MMNPVGKFAMECCVRFSGHAPPIWPRAPGTTIVWILTIALQLGAHANRADALDIAGPANSFEFGNSVALLPNGNIVVIDPEYSGVGAAHLYSPDGNRISTLTGSQSNDEIGSSGVVVLANGNYVILSPNWHDGTGAPVGAATWGSETVGASGVVSASNSLVGTTANDAIGSLAIPLNNGHYVVWNSFWHNGSTGASNAGAVTWCNGDGSTVGAVSASNSLVGTQPNDYVGWQVIPLSNGNYVVVDEGVSFAGAVTWGDGNGGTVGAVTASNSLIGTGGSFVTALSNGNYVVASPQWSYKGINSVGAATWGNGSVGTGGAVTPNNSLIGTTAGDEVGYSVIALSNGNYVVGSQGWTNGSAAYAGAATWGDGNGGTVGVVSVSNSLYGSHSDDRVGSMLFALSNGNYVVGSPSWINGSAASAGAATWGDGKSGTVGAVSADNSLVGANYSDGVGNSVIALSNGNYVVNSMDWTRIDANQIASGSAGAATWCNGNGGTVGAVSTSNSLVGTSAGDYVGELVIPLSNGNYVVGSPAWSNGSTFSVGAATWGNGSGGTTGVVAPNNSLIGTTAGDQVGFSLIPLGNGNYVAATPSWTNGSVANAGAATWGDGTSGSVGVVSAGNSLVGTASGDKVGFDAFHDRASTVALSNGDYVVGSPGWTNGNVLQAGAITFRRGTGQAGATITFQNSVLGLLSASGYSMTFAFDASRNTLIVGRPVENIVTLFNTDLIFHNGFD